MKSGAKKIYNKAKCWHRHGKHKGRGLAAFLLNRQPVDLKHTGRI
ncbi:MAG: hypothetical protein ACE1ZI_04720 [Acidobacteriota bacterium]